MKTLYFFSITSLLFLFSCGSFDNVTSIQEGTWYACPDATNKQLIDNVISNANWLGFEGEDGNDYVEVKGISNGGETEGKKLMFQFIVMGDEYDLYWFGVDENGDGEFTDEEGVDASAEEIVAELCGQYGLSYDGDVSYEDTDEEVSEVDLPEGTMSVVDYQIDFSEGAKVEVYGALIAMSIDLIYLYQFPEMMPFLLVDISNLGKEEKRKIMGCGDGCEVTISGLMKSNNEITALGLSEISEIDPSKLYQ